MRPVWLVQRVRLRAVGARTPARDGLDGLFSFDYMGSHEFETGVTHRAMRALRAMRLPPPVKLRSGASEAWYVGAAAQRSVAQTFLDEELGIGPSRSYVLKARSGLRESVVPRTANDREWAYDGWWALDPGPSWALFRTEEAARLWWTGVTQPASAGAGKQLLEQIDARQAAGGKRRRG